MQRVKSFTDVVLFWRSPQNIAWLARSPEIDAEPFASIDEIEPASGEQADQLRSCYRLLCRHLSNRALRSSQASLQQASLQDEEDPDMALRAHRHTIVEMLARDPSLIEQCNDLFHDAYTAERRKLAAETNIAIAVAKFPPLPSFYADDADAPP
jgi:hypothetical protein